MVASWTPCVASLTVSLPGHLVAATRRRSSTSWSSGTLTWKARISTVALYGSLSTCAVASCVTVVSFLSVELFFDVTVCVYPGMARPTTTKRQASTSAPGGSHRIDLDDIACIMFLLPALQTCSRMTNSKLLKMCDLTVRAMVHSQQNVEIRAER